MVAVEIAVVLALVLLNGFFAMSEMAIVSSRRPRLQQLAQQGDRGARLALSLTEDPSRFLSVVQVGITLIGILAGAFSGATLADKLGHVLNGVPGLAPHGSTVAFALVVIAITYLSLILGELVPKRIALAAPEPIAARVAGPIMVVARIGRPFVHLLSLSTAAVLRLIGVKPRSDASVTEDEVRTVIAEGVEAGSIAPGERLMMERVLSLADRPLRAIMTPRADVWWIDVADPPERIRRDVRESPYSRLVAARDGALDAPLGVVQKKDLLHALLDGRELDARTAIREPLVLPESTSVLRALEAFKRSPVHIAFLVDELGTFEGLVTLNDVLEAIAGTLPEEHEQGTAPRLTRRLDGSWLVDGRAGVDELRETLGLGTLPEGDYHTAAGLALGALGRVPSEGEHFELAGWRVEVIDMDERRIDKLLFTPPVSDEG